MLQIPLQVLGVPKVLRGHESALHEVGPRVGLQGAVPGLAHPVAIFALLEFADAVVLTPEGDEVGYGGLVAAFDVGAHELASLGEGEGVDGGGGGQDGVG